MSSVLNKKWAIKNEDKKASLLQKLLANRGLSSDEEIERFFHPSAERDFHDPFLMKGMDKAVSRIGTSIEKGERIMIFGDYDVDGITGGAILMRALTKLGAKVSCRLPHRIEDGYGLREKFVREFEKLEVKVIITVDNGIACRKEVSIANELGIDAIITDHHTIPEKLPEAFVLLHPKLPGCGYPFAELTGAGVALKLAQALFMRRINDEKIRTEETRKLLDLASMGTIADIGLLKGENRFIVKEGLAVLENTRWPGLSRLKESAGIRGRISTHDIGFLLGPRINAAGRISHPQEALRLLLHDRDQTTALADNLEKLNRTRQKMMEEIMETAEELVKNCEKDPAIIINHHQFHGGIIGLIAGKLSEKYARPAIVMEERGKIFVGSCRSIPGVNIFDALKKAEKLFNHFGGHAAAAGFDLPKENLENFKKTLNRHFKKELGEISREQTVVAECKISHDEISKKTVEILNWFEPFGIGNEKPKFLCENLKIGTFTTVGAQKKHLKIISEINGTPLTCMGFGLGKFAEKIKRNQTMNAICEIEENNWNGDKKIQIKIVDMEIA